MLGVTMEGLLNLAVNTAKSGGNRRICNYLSMRFCGKGFSTCQHSLGYIRLKTTRAQNSGGV